MLDRGISLRVAFMWLTWVCTGLVIVADYALWDAPHLGQLSIIFITIAATLTILEDNARTRRVVRVAVCDATEPPPGPNHLTSVS